MGTEQKEAQARSVGRQQLDVGLLEGEVPQDNGNLQHPLGLHVFDPGIPRRVEEAVLALLARRTVCKGHNATTGEGGACVWGVCRWSLLGKGITGVKLTLNLNKQACDSNYANVNYLANPNNAGECH